MNARQGRITQTVQLHRFVKLNDRLDSQIFTFIVPSQLVRGILTEVFSKDFFYCNQIWSIKFERTETHIGSFICLKSCLAGMKVELDYTFTVINREHFTSNENFSQKCVEFNTNKMLHGRASFCEIADLKNREFLYDDFKFLIELELKNGLTTFVDDVMIPKDPRELANCDGRLETGYFSFGTCDWNVIIQIAPSRDGDYQHSSGHQAHHVPSISLVRHNRFEHWCKVRYRVVFTAADAKLDTGPIDQQLDTKGNARHYRLDTPFFKNLSPKTPFRIAIEMQTMSIISTLELMPTSHNKNCTRFYDSQQQEWLVQSDILGRLVKLRFFYTDIHNVPRGFSRLVSWNAQIIPFSRGKHPVKAVSGPYTAFFTQKENDEGYEVAMDLAVEEVCDTSSGYTNTETGALSIVVEWLHSHLLYQDQYHVFDNLMRLQKLQMSREISVLQAENYALEKQVHIYQQSISTKEISDNLLNKDHGSTVSLPNNSMNPAHASIANTNRGHASLDSSSSGGRVALPTRDLPRLSLSGQYSAPPTPNSAGGGGTGPTGFGSPGATPLPRARTEDAQYDAGRDVVYHHGRSSRSLRDPATRHSVGGGGGGRGEGPQQHRGRMPPVDRQPYYQSNGGDQQQLYHQTDSQQNVQQTRHSYSGAAVGEVERGTDQPRSAHQRHSKQTPRVGTPVLGAEPGFKGGESHRHPRATSPTAVARGSRQSADSRLMTSSYSSRHDYGAVVGHEKDNYLTDHRSSSKY